MVQLGQRIAALREEAGISQPQLAHAARVPLASLRNWEQGKREPRIANLVAISRAVGVGVDAILEGVEFPEPNPLPPPRPRGRPRKA